MADERQLLERVPAVLYVLEGERLTYVSPHVEALLGHPAEHFLAAPDRWAQAVHPDDRRRRPGGAPYRMLDRHGGAVWVRDLRRAVGGRAYGALVEAAAPGADALHDPTTLLPGEALLREHLQLAVARARDEDASVAVLHLAVEGLELVDASLGRAARARALRLLAGRLRAAVPEPDLVAAVGDGELAVLIADLDGDAEEVAEARAGQLLVAAQEPLALDGHELELTLTTGVSVLPRDAPDAEALLRHARAATHEARRAESPLAVYAGGTLEALERLLVTARLRRALAGDELVLHFQPIFALASGAVTGVEALLRWQRPSGELVPPLAFVPLAERTGLIGAIGRWVVAAACAQARAWREEGLDVVMNLNASLHQFRDPGFVDSLRDAVAEHGLEPSRLMVEVTESTAMRDPACIEPVVAGLRGLGIGLAIDDFGAGHSSLARLRDLAADQLKIDRGFLSAVPGDRRAADLIGAALDLGDALGMRTVVEGVESESQRRFLVDRGCDLAQGFHLARPLPADEVTALLRDQRVEAGR